MFCPKCGNPDQVPETYCRRCGTFLPDLSKPVKKPIPPETHLTANIVLSAMTVVASFTLAILIWTVIGFSAGHWLVYAAAGLLFAMGCWHVQTLWRTLLLRKQFREIRPPRFQEELEQADAPRLEPADQSRVVPPSITERTTTRLGNKIPRS